MKTKPTSRYGLVGGLRPRHYAPRESRKGRPPQTIDARVVREVNRDEFNAFVQNAPSSDSLPITRIRYIHHRVAELLVSGRTHEEISHLTGMSPGWIGRLLNGDPAFRELLAYYETNRAVINIDVWERMKAVGLASLEELQTRLDEAPDEWTKRELMELADLMLVKGAKVGAPANAPMGQSGQPLLQIQFVDSAHSVTIDGTKVG